jgi:hypothetical protein
VSAACGPRERGVTTAGSTALGAAGHVGDEPSVEKPRPEKRAGAEARSGLIASWAHLEGGLFLLVLHFDPPYRFFLSP